VRRSGRPYDTPRDGYRYLPEHAAALEERITMAPVPPDEIRRRGADATLVTTDIPTYLGDGVAPDVDTAIALYRLVQLFGTPNVPGLEAGADQGNRDRLTWQYLFRVVDDPDASEAPTRECLLSVYDDRTSVSAGLSEFRPHDDGPVPDGDRVSLEPTGDPLPSGLPADAYLRDLVRLMLSTVEHAVEATYKGLHV
jgi:hypothetical protein